MNIESILTPERTFANLESTSKKRLLEKASGVLAGAEPGISEQHLYSKLIAREKIGPTAIGNGIAIPHCRVECSKTFAALFKLSRGIDFGAIDEVPVRIVFVLIAFGVGESILWLFVIVVVLVIIYALSFVVVVEG